MRSVASVGGSASAASGSASPSRSSRGEQRIALQLGLDEGLELNIRQLQQLDRLLQLRRDDKALALPDLESRAERQGRSPLACFLLATLAARRTTD